MRLFWFLVISLFLARAQAATLTFLHGPSGENNADITNIKPGESVTWDNVSSTSEGFPLSARLILQSSSDTRFTRVDFTNHNKDRLQINVFRETCPETDPIDCSDLPVDLQFRLEFFQPTADTPVSLKRKLLVQDIDFENADNYELVGVKKSEVALSTTESASAIKLSSSASELVISSTNASHELQPVTSVLLQLNKTSFVDFNMQVGIARKTSRIYIDGRSDDDYFATPNREDVLPEPPAVPLIWTPINNQQFGEGELIRVTGQSKSDDHITVFLNKQPACQTTATFSGTWTCDLTGIKGANTMTVTAADEHQQVSSESPPIVFLVGDHITPFTANN